MIEIMILFWILVFFIFFIGGIFANSKWLGAISGIWLLLFSIFIITTGVQLQSGMNITYGVSSDNITYSYQNVIVPYTTYSVIWGVTLLLASLYIFFNNLLVEK